MLSAVQSGAENGVNWKGQLEGHAGGPSTFHAATQSAMLNRIVRAEAGRQARV